MKILWFTNTPSLYKNSRFMYNGGGWIESLEKIIANENNIELAISFFHPDECFKIKQENTTYYPIPLYNNKLKKLRHNLLYNKYDKKEVAYYLKVIEDFQPDVIHIFGSERSYGLLSTRTDIPVIIHVQGILNPCLNAYFAPGSNKLELIKQQFLRPWKIIDIFRSFSFLNYNVKREAEILKNCKYFMGRTAWDRDVISLYSPVAKYYYCSEVLRDIFYTAKTWEYRKNEKMILISTVSKSPYKGFDLILKTAKLLKELTSFNFNWNVFGVCEYREWEKKLGIKCADVSVYLKGVADSTTLVNNIQNAQIFIHPSYIDNSSNSVCEAQLLGIPVISTNVGGISSLIEDNVTGYLVPANDPYTLASRIIKIKHFPEESAKVGQNARRTAYKRHDKQIIKNDLLKIYNELNYAESDHKGI